MKTGHGEWKIEHDIFHMLTRRYRRRDVEEVYIPIQAAMAFGHTQVDVGAVAGKIMQEGRLTMDRYCINIGADGLAFFHFLFVTELIEAGPTDYHMKTAADPDGAAFRAEYNESLEKLGKARDAIIEKHDWVRFSKVVKDALGERVKIISLGE
jgi:hypothetical protein